MSNAEILQNLTWQVLMGADEATGDAPQDRTQAAAQFAEMPKIAMMQERKETSAVRPVSSVVSAATLAELEESLRNFDGLSIKKSANNLVFGKGNPESNVMFIGEAPGADEDRQGRPFVGVSGQLLDRAKAAIGLDDTNSYTTNVIYWRPPGNRKPTPQETATILPFVIRHIELVDPKFIVLLGDSACKALLGRPEGITRLRGQWFDYQSPGLSHPIPTLATYHPAFLLRSPSQKALIWRDLLALKRRLSSLPTSASTKAPAPPQAQPQEAN